MSDKYCDHLIKAYEWTRLLSLPPKQRWICKTCGHIGARAVTCLDGDYDFDRTVKKFKMEGESDE